jgi:hypothetical protein
MKKSFKGSCSSFTELFAELSGSEKLESQQLKRRANSDWVDALDPEIDEDDEDDFIKSEHELLAEYYPIKPEHADW